MPKMRLHKKKKRGGAKISKLKTQNATVMVEL